MLFQNLGAMKMEMILRKLLFTTLKCLAIGIKLLFQDFIAILSIQYNNYGICFASMFGAGKGGLIGKYMLNYVLTLCLVLIIHTVLFVFLIIDAPDPHRTYALQFVNVAVCDTVAYQLLIDLELIYEMAKELTEEQGKGDSRGYCALYTGNEIINAIQAGDWK